MPPRRANQNQVGGSQNQSNEENIPLADLATLLRASNANNSNQANGDQNQPQVENVTLASLVALIQAVNAQNTQQNPPAVQPQVDRFHVAEKFQRFKPYTFNGRDGPAVLEEWMDSIEGIFNLMMCTDPQKVACAVFQMKEDVRIWWTSYWRMRPTTERESLTWARFREIVTEKYYPPSFQIQKESEFFNLKQGSMTVAEYERKFSDLSRFAHHLVDTELKKSRRFRNGLCSEIRNVLSGQGLTTLAETYERAEEVAASFAMDAQKPKEVEFSGKRKWNGGGSSKWNGGGPSRNPTPNKQAKVNGYAPPKGITERPTCAKCGKNHFGECLLGQSLCFKCKKPGHMVPNCPLMQNGGDGRKPNAGAGGNARMFAMTHEEADQQPGTMAVNQLPLPPILSTHSLLSPKTTNILFLLPQSKPKHHPTRRRAPPSIAEPKPSLLSSLS
ncbi:hypothetical protein ACS0TY_002840 [Phlomoides rotata]